MEFDEAEVLGFVRTTIISVTALELLFLLKAREVATVRNLVRELRSSETALHAALYSLEMGQLLTCEADGICRYNPATPALRRTTSDVERLYRAKPLAVIRAILDTPDEKLRMFASAFRLRSDR